MRKVLVLAALGTAAAATLGGCVAYGPGYGSPGYGYAPAAGASITIGWHGDNYWDGHRYWARRDWEARHPEMRRDRDDHDNRDGDRRYDHGND